MNKKIKKVIFSLIIVGIIFGTGFIMKFSNFERLEGYMYSLGGITINSATSCNATSCNATSSNATSSNATSSNATSSNATSSNATSSNATSSNATSSNATSNNAINNNGIKVENKVESAPVVATPVVEEKAGDLQYNNSQITQDTLNEILNSKDEQNIIINVDGNVNISKSIFESIKGKEKQLTINSGIHQIIFNGKDVINSKDINAQITCNTISEDSQLKEIAEKGIVINFANNGELPGPATIRIKVTDEIKTNLSLDNIYVYYYDESAKELTQLSSKAKYDGENYIEFVINHNSKYVFVNSQITENTNEVVNNVNNQEKNEVSFLESYIMYIIVIAVSILVIIVVTIIVIVSRKKKIQ